MRKQLGWLAIPFAASLALAGTGFGVWVFVTDSSKQDLVNFKITPGALMANFTATSNGLVLLDQAKPVSDGTSITIKNGSIETYNGVAVTNDGTSYLYSGVPTTPASFKVNYTIACSITGGISEYIRLVSIGGQTASPALVSVTGSKSSSDFNTSFDWVAGKKPTTFNEYKAMVNACGDASGSSIQYTIVATGADAV